MQPLPKVVPANHPYQLIRELAQKDRSAHFNFRLLAQKPGLYGKLEREIVDETFFSAEILDNAAWDWIRAQQGEVCRDTAEVVVDSAVMTSAGYKYIPMLDLVTKDAADLVKFCGRWDLWPFGVDVQCYASGNSFHVYGRTLLTEEQRLRWLGGALLISQPDQPQLVDTRWVGHSLTKGFESLRLTANGQNRVLPSRVEVIDPIPF